MINTRSVCIYLNNKMLSGVLKFGLSSTYPTIPTDLDFNKWGVEFHQLNPANESERRVIHALGTLHIEGGHNLNLVVELDPATLSEQPY